MRLPRRVPWATVTELDQLCSWVYATDAHDSSRNLAIERVRITRSRSKLGRQNAFLHEGKKKVAFGMEIHDAPSARSRVPSLHLGRHPTRQRLLWRRPVLLVIPTAELRHCAHPPRQRSGGSSPSGYVRALHTLHRRTDRPPGLARRAAARRDARGPAEPRAIARWRQRGERPPLSPPPPPRPIPLNFFYRFTFRA